MKILVTGGTGFIGKNLCVDLFCRGHDLVLLTRNRQSVLNSFPVPCEVIEWDFDSPLSSGQFKEIEAVVNLAGEPVVGRRWTNKVKERIYSSRIKSTQHLVDSSMDWPLLKVFVSASAIGYYGNQQSEKAKVEDSLSGEGFLAEVCRDWEQVVVGAYGRSLVRHVVVRIGLVIGQGGGLIERLVPIANKGLLGRIGSGQFKMSWIQIDDLVRIFVTSLENQEYEGSINAVAGVVNNREFTERICRNLKVIEFLPIPRWVLRLLYGEAESAISGDIKVRSSYLNKKNFSFQFPNFEDALKYSLKNVNRGYVFSSHFWVPYSIESVFSFFSDEENLELLSPSWIHFKKIEKSSESIQRGTKIDYKLKIKGISFRWQSLISLWQPPTYFVDEQIRGPYSYWYHDHKFKDVRGGTLIIDQVTYKVPFGLFGDLFFSSWIKKSIIKIFQFRKKRMSIIFDPSYSELV